jgi:hypothetical protein
MDNNPNVSQSGHGVDEHSSVRTLTKIIPSEWPPKRLQWLWNQLVTVDYALDDFARVIGPQAFLGQLFDPKSEWYEIGDNGVVAITGIIPQCNALVHFATWGDIDVRELFPLQKQLFNDLFTTFELHRLSAYIPAFNKEAIRMATLVGFRYEGEIRQVFLRNKIFHNLQLYGMLRSEFYRREVRQ